MSNPRFTLQDRINSIMESSVVQRGYNNKAPVPLPGRAESGKRRRRRLRERRGRVSWSGVGRRKQMCFFLPNTVLLGDSCCLAAFCRRQTLRSRSLTDFSTGNP